MNFDDDTQLSAFLDDELDPGDRMAVAWEVESSTATARQLADLQSARDLVRGLGRPTIPVDLGAAVLAELAARRPQARPRSKRSTGVRRFAAAFVGVASLAASLMVAMVLLHRTLHDDAHPWLFSRANRPAALSRQLDPVLVAPLAAAEPAADQSPRSLAPSHSISHPQSQATTALDRTKLASNPTVEGPEPARPGQVDALLGHRKVFRALIVTDVLDRASRDVRSIIEHDGLREPEFGRITLAQGIVIDPEHPGEAEVYSVVMDEPSLRPFVEQIRAKFPAVELHAETEPTLVTQLSEVGQVAVFADVRPARLGLPPRELPGIVAGLGGDNVDHFPPPAVARLDPTEPPDGGFAADPLARAQVADKTTPPIAGKPSRARPQAGLPAAPAKPAPSTEPVTVLVWVARSTPRARAEDQPPMIDVAGLSKRYHAVHAVDRLTFGVDRGEIVGFLGPNGAGKTTTMRMLTTFLTPTSGRATLAGFDVLDAPLEVRRHVGYLPEGVPLYPEMRVREYLNFRARIKDLPRSKRAAAIDRVLDRCRLGDVDRRVLGHLSKGYKQRVGLADAMLHDPDILILDEPTSGLDPIQIREVRALIRELGDRHTILLSTHIMSEVEAVCGRVVMIVGGRIALDQPLDRIQARNVVLVEARGPAAAIGHALKSVPGVVGVESRQQDADWHRFEVAVGGDADLRESIAGRIVAGGWGVRLLDLARSSLEDRFVRAVQEASLRRESDPDADTDSRAPQPITAEVA